MKEGRKGDRKWKERDRGRRQERKGKVKYLPMHQNFLS
jgi:hypothetical protein